MDALIQNAFMECSLIAIICYTLGKKTKYSLCPQSMVKSTSISDFIAMGSIQWLAFDQSPTGAQQKGNSLYLGRSKTGPKCHRS